MKKILVIIFCFFSITAISFSEISKEEKDKLLEMANIEIRNGNIKEAVNLFEKILKGNESDTRVEKVLAKLYSILGDEKKEEKLYLKVAEEGDDEAKHRLAELYYSQQRYDEALILFEELAQKEKKGDIYLNVGLVYENLRNYKKAKEWYIKAANEKNLDSMFYLGTLAASEGNYKEAIKWYEKPAKKNHAKSQNNLGYTYYRLKNNRKAKYWLEKALITAEKIPDIEVMKAAQDGLNEIQFGRNSVK